MWPDLPPIWFEIEIFLIVSSGGLLLSLLIGMWLKADFRQEVRWTSSLTD